MILSDNETKLDLLNNKAIAKTVVSIINDSKESVSIGVHGDWGAGKSSILAMVEELLESKQTDDSLDWEDWDESDPEGATDVETYIDATGCVTVRFNSWQYQGFEDAKIALMSAIVKALQNEARYFYKQHPVKGAFKRIKELSRNIWNNIDKLSLAKNVSKVGVSLVTGTTPIALLDIATKHAKDIFTDEEKRNEFVTTAGSLLKNTSNESSTYKEMAEFRVNYIELFKAAHIERLVVLIDDLDRCLPKVAIETLEAVRMFLAMKNTAFVIAADDEMIRYSVKEYFPRVLEKESEGTSSEMDYNRFSDKYLEKLIQIPLHIPRIGIAEAQLYVLMLFIESRIGHGSPQMKELANTVILKLNKPWALEQLTTGEIKELVGDSYSNIVNEIKIAKNIDQFLAEHTGGNPRNIKRFVNMLLLRTEVARNRGFGEKDLEMAILAKMMLVEQYNYDFYKAIAGELREDGTCQAFDIQPDAEEGATEENETLASSEKEMDCGKKSEVKAQVKAKASKSVNKDEDLTSKSQYRNSDFSKMLAQEDIKEWMASEPMLNGIDLRPYFFACAEKEDFFFSSQEERLRELLTAIRYGKLTVISMADQIRNLENGDAMYIFKRISNEVFRSNLNEHREPKIIEGLRGFVVNRTELQLPLVDFLHTLPGDKLGVWATGGWDECIPKESEARTKLIEFFKMIQEQTTDSFVKNAALAAQR